MDLRLRLMRQPCHRIPRACERWRELYPNAAGLQAHTLGQGCTRSDVIGAERPTSQAVPSRPSRRPPYLRLPVTLHLDDGKQVPTAEET